MLRIVIILLFNSFLVADGLTLLHEYKQAIQNNSEKEIEALYESEKSDWVSPASLSLSTYNESSRQITHQKPFLWGMLKIFRA